MSSAPRREDPTPLRQLHRDAQTLLEQRNFGAAQQACLHILRADPAHADAHFLLGVIAAELGRYANATEFLYRAIDLDGRQGRYHAQLGRCLAVLKRPREAAEAASRAVVLANGSALTLDTAGVVFSHAGDHVRAADAFRHAVSRAPENPAYRFNLASSLQFAGDFDGAEQTYEAAIERSPRFYKAHSALSHLRRQTPEKNHIDRLRGLLANVGDDVDGRLHLGHALSRELEDLGRYDEAFECLADANQRKRATMDYSSERDHAIFSATENVFDRRFLSGGIDGHRATEPIFIVGMPRTGTTLVERILSSHTQVMSAGELQNLPLAVKRIAGTQSGRVLDPETIRTAPGINFRALGKQYIDSTRPATARSPHFIDKMPLNFLYLGFIRLALPNAKIICLRRNPMDTCLSNFRQLFSIRFSYYDYAYDLREIAEYFTLFDRLISHWQDVMPGRILEVGYERLVEGQEAESRRIIDHCGLDWEDGCLSFERNKAPVATASSAQVREPIYRTAVGRWKHYEKQLAPVREYFESRGIAVD